MTNKTKPLSVLIVDDSPPVRETLRAVLTTCAGVEIAGEAGSVPRAIQLLDTLQPDVVVLDFALPGGSGLDVLARTRQLPVPPIVIFFSIFTPPYLKAACLQRGADYFFDKATEFEALCETVMKLAPDSPRN